MINTILDNTIIILLTISGLFHSKAPVFFIMAAAVIMIRITYESFLEEKNNNMIMADMVLLSVFAVLSGNVTGFFALYLQRDVKIYVRTSISILLFVISQGMVVKDFSMAMCILQTLLLLGGFVLLEALYRMIEWSRQRNIREYDRLLASNISELHEKRLNEQLVLQKFVDERNARLLERENISRNIHNSVGHSITAAIMTLDAADMLYDVKPEEARKKMNAANGRIRESLESIRRAVRVLDEENTTLTAKDLKEELSRIITEFVMDTSIQVLENYSELSDDIVIPRNHLVFLTGVLQELLTNGVKHGNAGRFVVMLSGDLAHVRLAVSDNGNSDFSDTNGKQRIEKGFGLKKILSYAEKCGGKAIFENASGFKTTVELPIVSGGEV